MAFLFCCVQIQSVFEFELFDRAISLRLFWGFGISSEWTCLKSVILLFHYIVDDDDIQRWLHTILPFLDTSSERGVDVPRQHWALKFLVLNFMASQVREDLQTFFQSEKNPMKRWKRLCALVQHQRVSEQLLLKWFEWFHSELDVPYSEKCIPHCG